MVSGGAASGYNHSGFCLLREVTHASKSRGYGYSQEINACVKKAKDRNFNANTFTLAADGGNFRQGYRKVVLQHCNLLTDRQTDRQTDKQR